MKKFFALLLAGVLLALPSFAVEVRPDKAVRIVFDENADVSVNSVIVDGISCGAVAYTHDDDATGTATDFAGTIEECTSAASGGTNCSTAVTLADDSSGVLPKGRHLFRVNPSTAPGTGDVSETVFRCQEEFSMAPSPNTVTDTDGDGLFDYVAVSDYDGDGTLEMADIQAAYEALDDTARRHVYVLPGSYAAATSVPAGHTRAFIELGSNTTLECASRESVTLNANQFISDSAAETQVDLGVVGNDDTGDPNVNITVKNCTLDGNWAAGRYFSFGDISTGDDTIDLHDGNMIDLDPNVDDHGFATGDGPFQVAAGLGPYMRASSTFETTGDTIVTDGGGSFAGMGFVAGTVTVAESDSNNAALTISDVTTSTLTSSTNLTDEGPTGGVTFTQAAALPAGLSANTDYWVIRTDADTIQLATSQANALASTAVDITGVGAGSRHVIGVDTTGFTRNASMGFYFRNVRNLTIENNRVVNTYHAPIYVSNATDSVIRGNTTDYGGAYAGENASSQACLYLFATGGSLTTDILVEGNMVEHCEGAAYNTRADDFSSGDRIDRITFLDNKASRTNGTMFTLQTTRDSTILNAHGTYTGGILLNECLENAYLEDTATDTENCNARISIANVTIDHAFDLHSGNPYLFIDGYNEDITVNNFTASGFDKWSQNGTGTCLTHQTPTRNVVLRNVSLSGCAQYGIRMNGPTGPGLVYENVSIADSGLDSTGEAPAFISATAALTGFQWIGGVLKGAPDAILQLQVGGQDLLFKDLVLDGAPPRYKGTSTIAALPTCNDDTFYDVYKITDGSGAGGEGSDCSTAGGTAQAWCRCEYGGWGYYSEGSADLTPANGMGYEDLTGGPAVDIHIDGLTVYDVDLDCVKLRNTTTAQVKNVSCIDTGLHIAQQMDNGVTTNGSATGILIDGYSIQCENISGNCHHPNSTTDFSDFAAGSTIVNTNCTATDTCTTGSTCLDSGDGQSYGCEAGNFVAW